MFVRWFLERMIVNLFAEFNCVYMHPELAQLLAKLALW